MMKVYGEGEGEIYEEIRRGCALESGQCGMGGKWVPRWLSDPGVASCDV